MNLVENCFPFLAGRPLKAPNRKKFDEDLESLNLTVKQKEDELVSFESKGLHFVCN